MNNFKIPGGIELSEKIPDELFQMVEAFKKFVRDQKAYRDQKFDIEPILEVGRETEEFEIVCKRILLESDRNARLVEQIREETAKLLRNSELAYSLLNSNQKATKASSDYFAELADQFEAKMRAYGEKIKELKMSLEARSYSGDELFMWLKKQHEALGDIAAIIYLTHERMMETSN